MSSSNYFRGEAHGARKRNLAVGFALLVLLVGTLAAQQASSRLTGIVTDDTGGIIPGVLVTATNQGTGISHEVITNDQGSYTFASLPPSTYTISAELSGFKKSTTTDFLLETATTKTLDITLEVGDITQEVTVVAQSVQQIQLETSDLGDVVFERKIKDLPLNGRRPIELVLLQPGMAGNPGQGNAGGFVANGGRNVSNAIYLDGVDITNSELGTGSTVGGEPNIQIFTEVSPSVDALEEFRVITGSPSAEFSRSTGFQVAMTTKSGTNDYHGSVYNFHRNTVLNANEFFNNANDLPREPLRRNQFGFTIGGPVWIPKFYDGKNKTFFFYNFEGKRQGQSATVTRTVYTKEARQGLFRHITRNTTQAPNGSFPSRNTGAILDPNTGTILPGTEGIVTQDIITPDFDGIGRDPSGLVDRILAQTPLPNDFSSFFNGGSSSSEGRDGLNLSAFVWQPLGNEDSNIHTIKMDHLINQDHTFTGRFVWGYVDRDQGDFVNNVFAPYPGIPSRGRLEDQFSGGLTLISSFGSSITNEARLGVSRNRRQFTQTEKIPGAMSLNVPGTDPFRRDQGLNFPRQSTTFNNNLTWIRGNHSMKMGFQVQSTIFNTGRGFNAIDSDQSPFSDGVSVDLRDLIGSAARSAIPSSDRRRAERLFNYLTGRIGEISARFIAISADQWGPLGTSNIRGYRGRDWGGFVQDDWKVSPNLTLNLGMRYDYYQVPWEVNSFFTLGVNRSIVDPQVDPSMPDTPIQFGPVGPAFGTQIFQDDFNNFSPVIGFSWDPFGNNKTAIRGSFRISYDHLFTNTLENVDNSQPGLQREVVTQGEALFGIGGITNADGEPRAPRWFDLKEQPLTGVPGNIGTPNGPIDLRGIIDGLIEGTKPLESIPNNRENLAPDDFEKGLVNPYSQLWSIGIQHEVMENTVVEGRYVGRVGRKLYTGLPANQFRVPDGWLEGFQTIQVLMNLTKAESYALAGADLPDGMDPNDLTDIFDLYGSVPRGATDISQYIPGNLASLAPDVLMNLMLAASDRGRGDFEAEIRQLDLNGLMQDIDRNSGSRLNGQAFIESAGLNPVGNFRGAMPLILGLQANAFAPSPQFRTGPDLVSNAATSDYHAFQAQVTRRFSQGLQFQANYTFSKNLDLPFSNFGSGNSYNNFFNRFVERSLSGNDLRHDFKANAIWEVPVGQGRRFGSGMNAWADGLLGGWQLSSIVSIAGDFPFNVIVDDSARTDFQGGRRPQLLVARDGGVATEGKVGRNAEGEVIYWKPDFVDNFGEPLLGTLGTTPRNWLRGPGYWNVDLSIMKHFSVHEEMQLQFRAEFFNIFNNVNFSNPERELTDNDFGRITNQNGDPRIIQFALKFTF